MEVLMGKRVQSLLSGAKLMGTPHTLPSHPQAEKAVLEGVGTPVDHFVAHYEVVDDADIWRQRLTAVVKQAYKLGWNDREGGLLAAQRDAAVAALRERDEAVNELFTLRNRAGCGPEQAGPDVWAERDAATSALAKAEGEARKIIMDVTAHLVAAVSLLKRGGKKAAPSDKMFTQMIKDYEASIDRARAALTPAPEDAA